MHEHVLWQHLQVYWISRSSVNGQGFVCVHDTAATRGLYLASSKVSRSCGVSKCHKSLRVSEAQSAQKLVFVEPWTVQHCSFSPPCSCSPLLLPVNTFGVSIMVPTVPLLFVDKLSTDWLVGSLLGWQTDWLNEWMNRWLIDWLIDWLAEYCGIVG